MRMSTEETAEVLLRFNQAYADNNPSALEDLVAVNCVMESIQPAPNGTRYEADEVNLKFWQAMMADRVKTKLEDKTERIVLIKGDQDASYSAIMAAMDDLRKVGIEDIGLITERKSRPATTGGK